MKKQGIIGIALLATIFLTNCAGMIQGMIDSAVTKAPFANRIFMHENPQVGDYSITKTYSKINTSNNVGKNDSSSIAEGITKYEVIAVSEETVTVMMTYDTLIDGKANPSIPIMKYQLFVNRQGEVQKAFFLDSTGKYIPLSILKPGSQSFIDFDPAKAQTIRITTPLGEQECYAYVQTMDMEKYYEEQGIPNTANIKGITRNILLISKDPKVKFRVLGGFGSINMSADDYNVEFSADKITQYYGKQNTNAQSYTIMAEQGNYTAEFRSKVAPIDPATTTTSSVPSDTKKMPVNESFDSGLGGWALETFNGATGDLRRDKGDALGTGPSAKFSIYSGSVDWYVQMIKPFSSKKGKIYKLTATLKADKPCTIQVFIEQNHEPHNRILSGKIQLDSNPQTFTFISTKASTDQMKLTFMAGSQPGRIIWVDSVTLDEE